MWESAHVHGEVRAERLEGVAFLARLVRHGVDEPLDVLHARPAVRRVRAACKVHRDAVLGRQQGVEDEVPGEAGRVDQRAREERVGLGRAARHHLHDPAVLGRVERGCAARLRRAHVRVHAHDARREHDAPVLGLVDVALERVHERVAVDDPRLRAPERGDDVRREVRLERARLGAADQGRRRDRRARCRRRGVRRPAQALRLGVQALDVRALVRLRDDELARLLVRDAVCSAVVVEEVPAAQAQARLERVGRVVEACARAGTRSAGGATRDEVGWSSPPWMTSELRELKRLGE
jgi:hypothetical protein